MGLSGVLEIDGVKRSLPHFVKAKSMIALNERAIEKGAEFIRALAR